MNKGVGRRELRKYIVAVRYRDEAHWPAECSKAVQAAQRNYDLGAVELTQAQTAKHTILYAIPRKTVAGRPHRHTFKFARQTSGQG